MIRAIRSCRSWLPWRLGWRRALAALLVVAIAGTVLAGLAQVRVDTRVESFLPAQDPASEALQDKAHSFGGDPIVVLLKFDRPRELLLNQRKLIRLVGLEGDLAQLPDVAEVYGPGTVLNQIAGSAQNMLAQISGSRDALRKQAEQRARQRGAGPAEAAAAGEAAVARFDRRYGGLLVQGLPAGLPTLRNPQFVSTVLYGQDGRPSPEWHFVVPDEHTVAVSVRPRENLDQAAAARLSAAVRSTVHSAGLSADKVTITGVPVLTSALAQRAQDELLVLGAVAIAAVGLVFVLVPWTRRRRSRLRPLLAALIGTATTMSAFGWLGHPVSLGVVAFLPILLGIGSDFPFYLSQSRQRGRRVLVAAMAAAAGFGSLGLSPLPFVRELGLALAVGILVTAGVSLLLRRVFDVVDPPSIPPSAPAATAGRVPLWRRTVVLAVAAAIAGAGWVALPGLSIEGRPDQLARGLPALAAARHAEDALGSAGEVSVMLRGANVLTPQALAWAREAEDKIVRQHGDEMRPVITPSALLGFLGSNATPAQVSAAMKLLPPYLTSAVIRPDQKVMQLVFGMRLGDLEQQGQLLERVRAGLPSPPPGTEVELVGLPVTAVRGLELVSDGRTLLNVAGILAACLVLAAGLRPRRDAGRAAVTVLLATGWVLALAWAVAGTLSPLTVAIGSLVTATGCEFAVMLTEARRSGHSWLHRSVAVAAAAGTVGYLVLGLSEIAVLREFGLLLAASVAASYLAAHVVVWLLPPAPRRSLRSRDVAATELKSENEVMVP